MEERRAKCLRERTPQDHAELMRTLEAFAKVYPDVGIGTLGCSILGREIPLLTLGAGPRKILYVGTHHGMEWMTATILLRFCEDLLLAKRAGKAVYKLSPDRFWESHTLYVVPMLNPDGVEYQLHGVDSENPLYQRLLTMNGGSDSFVSWQANARGVDLNHNYDAGFSAYKQMEMENDIYGGAPSKYSGEAPESEPEVAYLCSFIRFQSDLRAVLTLHTQGEEIYYRSEGKAPPISRNVARKMSLLSGYRLAEASGSAAFGGLTDWCIQKQNLPAFTMECGKGKNPLPLDAFVPIYSNIREVLFSFPLFF